MSSVIKAVDIVVVPSAAPKQPESAPTSVTVGMDGPSELARTLLNTAPLAAFAARRARDIMERAESEAAALLEAARAEQEATSEKARRQGYEDGRAEGLAAGAEAAEQAARERLDLLRAIVDEMARSRDAVVARYEDEIVQLALAVAARIVRRESSLSADTVRQLLQESLPRTGGTMNITITVNPIDMAALEADASAIVGYSDGRAKVEWVADESITPGGCIVETERGGIDATVETRVARIVESLLGVITGGD